ncbi:MAG TPA: lantibiotic dehydratase C-terminal domain-containing protein [Streptomyces sp.]|nr:lantibiotic dehydratase C-terminal domain-containing protein [Streptomyces sp.]
MNRQWLFVRLPNPMRSRPEEHTARVLSTMTADLVAHLRAEDPDALWRFGRPGPVTGPDLGLWFHSTEPVLKELERRLRAQTSEHNWPMITGAHLPETAKYRTPRTLRLADRLATVSSTFALELLRGNRLDEERRQWLAAAHLWRLSALTGEKERAAFLFHFWQFGTDVLAPADRVELAAQADAWALAPVCGRLPGGEGLWDAYVTEVRDLIAAGREDGVPVNFLLYDHVLLTHDRLGVAARTGARAARAVRTALAAGTPVPVTLAGATALQSA